MVGWVADCVVGCVAGWVAGLVTGGRGAGGGRRSARQPMAARGSHAVDPIAQNHVARLNIADRLRLMTL